MSSNDYANMLYTTNPQVGALNRVTGFNPLKLLRRTKSAVTGEEVLKLDLPYKKLWFRMACPMGRMRLKPLRVTELLAIYEAQIFLHMEDAEPVSSFTACIQKAEVPDGKYMEAAQNAALDKALTDAGFGIQLADVTSTRQDRQFGCEIPLTAVAGKEIRLAPAATVEKKDEQPAEEKMLPADAVTIAPAAPPREETHIQSAESVLQPKAEKKEPPTTDTSNSGADHALQILRGNHTAQSGVEVNTSTVPLAEYTPDMPLEEIAKRMSLEQAKAVVVDSGTCRGKTIEEVALRRKASLRFYLSPGYTSKNNIIRAAAQIMLESMDGVRKAG